MSAELKITRPLIRYHGGKFRLAPWLISHFPAHRVYLELYCGGGSVLLRKPKAEAEIINDLDNEIVNVFQVLRDRSAALELERLLRLTPFARAEFDLAYLKSDDSIERARRILVRSFCGVSSAASTRKNKSGWRSTIHPNVGVLPVHQWATFPDGIASFTERLSGVIIENRPALELIDQYSAPDRLIYADPPYPAETRTEALGNYRHEMTDEDHRSLARALRATEGAVIISGYACDLYDLELYPDWTRREHEARSERASARTEVIWMNEAATRARAQRGLFD